MKAQVIKTATGNYVAIINGVETFISQDGSRINPVQTPCFDHLSKHNCRPLELEYSEAFEIPSLFQNSLKNNEEARQAYLNNDAYLKEKADRAALAERMKAESEAKIIEAYLALPSPIPATVANIRIVLRYLNLSNWGGWSLPAMTIGYSAAQYDCEGHIATAIKLDRPISDEDMGIVNEKMFKVGGKNGYLPKYQHI